MLSARKKMERLADLGSIIRTLKAGLHKPNPANPDRKMWTLTDLDKKTDGWQTVEDDCNSSKSLFPKGYQGVKHRNLARINQPEERVEIIDPKDYPT